MSLKDLVSFGKKDVSASKDSEHPFALFRKEFDDLFDNFFRSVDLAPFDSKSRLFSPSIDVLERDNEICIKAELPGMDEKDIDVSLSRNILSIRGEKKEEKEDKGKDYYRMERSYGSFHRSVQLPAEVDESKINASFKKGVLKILLPKTAKGVEETKKIPVRTE